MNPQQPVASEGEAPGEALAPSHSWALWSVAPLIFGSGFCALIYQTAWQREFRLIFGVSTAASAAVIAVFMGGLGVGGWLLSSRADRHPKPLMFYGALEAVVGLTTLATPWLLLVARQLYLSLGGTVVLGDVVGTAVRLLLAGLVLLPPTFFAGGTLGAAARAVEDERDRWRTGTATLYGVNTLGAVAGSLAGTFWLFERLGTQWTLWSAAGINLIIAASAIAIGRRGQVAAVAAAPVRPDFAASPLRRGKPARPGRSARPARPAQSAQPALVPRETFVFFAAAVVGFAFFLMELVWYRMIGPILGGTVYTFGLVLAMALAGIAIGGLLYARLFQRRAVSGTAFGVTCLLESLAIAVPYGLGDQLALLANSMRPPAAASLSAYLTGWTTVTAIVVLPAAIVAGVQFPLLVALLGQGRARVARHIGRAYLWNTLGGIAGALAGGFGLIPVLTAPGCWRLVVVLLAVLSCVAILIERRISRPLIVAGLSAASIIAALFFVDGPTAVWRHGGIGVGRAGLPVNGTPNDLKARLNQVRRSIAREFDGVESSVAVQQIAASAFVVNGKVDGNARNDAPVQVMGGLLGALVNPSARRSLVIGLGTGSTAGWLAAVPAMERVDVVELEPSVLYVAGISGPVNHEAMSNPRVHVITGDAREVLMTGRDKYDIVFSEPSNPYRAGIASLFTKEFYDGVSSRLEPDGVFLQWVQAYEVDDWTIATIVATLNSVFPEIQIWQVHQADLVIVASRRPVRFDAAALRTRIKEEPFAGALKGSWRAVELEDVLARFLTGPEWAHGLRTRGQEINTDDRNRVEFAFARSLSQSERFNVAHLRRDATAIGAHRPAIDGAIDWDRVERQRASIYVIAGASPPEELETSSDGRTRLQALTKYLDGDLRGAVKTFEQQPSPPQGPVERTMFAEGLADLGDARAEGFIKELRDIDAVEAEAAAARLAYRVGDVEAAKNALITALTRYRTEPWASQVSMSHALALADELTLAHRDLVPPIFEALGQPFAVAALEEARRLERLSVEAHGATLVRCQEALAPFDAHIAWRLDVLQYRLQCYTRTNDLRLSQARADLEEFNSLEQVARKR